MQPIEATAGQCRPAARRVITRHRSLALLGSLLLTHQVAATDFSAQSLYSGPAPRPGPDVLYLSLIHI